VWLREHRPGEFSAARRFVSIKEYVTAPLIGEWVVDASVASATGLLDIAAHAWHGPALDLAGIAPDRLSSPVSGLTPFPLRTGLPVALPGLRPDASVFLGAGDGPLANLGSGARRPGAVNVDLGTSGAARAITRTPLVDAAHSLWCFCLTDDLWASGGIVTNVGNALQWLAGTFEPNRPPAESTARLVALAAEVRPGAEGLSFVPYLRRARSPYWDGRLRGVLHGLRAEHTAAHITRALLEAIAYDLHTITTRIDEHETLAEPLRLTGGLTRSVCIAQLLADVCGREVLVPRNTEGSIAGAALFGLRAAGVLDDFAFAGEGAPGDLFEPDPAAHATYTAGHRRHERLIGLLRSFEAEGDAG
jgi:gluconokinase